MEYSVVIFGHGENWEQDKPIWEQDLKPHQEYWRNYRLAEDKIIGGGPFMDHSGGMVILEVEDLEEATKLVQKDPAVEMGLFSFKVHPWHLLSQKF
ncbi:YciI family protein [Baia soyae]|uniref:Uncharacterized protein YciI n=1 Tax=Baia soyae TaxID=1544746 RepID=A0A4R2RR53_9BACL|nr:YciI family protein [Baia soyae]TCP65783.1 uncharacterized protein YciI [Baia soyae]